MKKELHTFWDILDYVVKCALIATGGLALYYIAKDLNETKRTVQAIHWVLKDMF